MNSESADNIYQLALALHHFSDILVGKRGFIKPATDQFHAMLLQNILHCYWVTTGSESCSSGSQPMLNHINDRHQL